MIEWNRSILSEVNDKSKCWICGMDSLSREHVYKRTDLQHISYNTETLTNENLGLWRLKSNDKPLSIQSLKSKYVKFQPSICETCNNSTTQAHDLSYEKVIDYFQHNRELIKEESKIDLSRITANWLELRSNLMRYYVKHVGCRLFASNIQPTENMIKFLNGNEELKDIKFVFQLKCYYNAESDEKRQIYLGPLTPFEQNHLFIGKKLTSVTGWYSFNEFSINYIVKKGAFRNGENAMMSKDLILDKIDYQSLDNKRFDEILEYPTYANLLEYLEYFPFVGKNRELNHYKYLKKFENKG